MLCLCNVPQLADLKVAFFQLFSFWAVNSHFCFPTCQTTAEAEKYLLICLQGGTWFIVSGKLPINSFHSHKTKPQTLMEAWASSWSARFAQESFSLVVVCPHCLAAAAHTGTGCCFSVFLHEWRSSPAGKKTWKLLVSILTDNMGAIAPGLLWCTRVSTAWSSIISRMSCSEIPNTQMLEKPSSSLLSFHTEHDTTIFIYISAYVELYIC